MSQTSQPPPAAEALIVRSLALTLPSSIELPAHEHPWGQVVFATEGGMSVDAGVRTWVVPRRSAVWVPPNTRHAVRAVGAVQLRTVYVRKDLVGGLPATCCVLSVSSLLREVILEVVRRGMLTKDRAEDCRLAHVLVDQISASPHLPVELLWPSDRRARRVAQAMVHTPDGSETLAQLARHSGASERTLTRLFKAETGMSLGRWRQQARVLHALRLLAEGQSVTMVALAAGYESLSAFVSMFKKIVGTTPGAFARREREHRHQAVRATRE